jgi:hypothetical protein
MKKSLFVSAMMVLFFLSSVNLYSKGAKKGNLKKSRLPGITFEACCANPESAKLSNNIMKKIKGRALDATRKCQFAYNVKKSSKKEKKGAKLVRKVCPEPKKVEPKEEIEEEQESEESFEADE